MVKCVDSWHSLGLGDLMIWFQYQVHTPLTHCSPVIIGGSFYLIYFLLYLGWPRYTSLSGLTSANISCNIVQVIRFVRPRQFLSPTNKNMLLFMFNSNSFGIAVNNERLLNMCLNQGFVNLDLEIPGWQFRATAVAKTWWWVPDTTWSHEFRRIWDDVSKTWNCNNLLGYPKTGTGHCRNNLAKVFVWSWKNSYKNDEEPLCFQIGADNQPHHTFQFL